MCLNRPTIVTSTDPERAHLSAFSMLFQSWQIVSSTSLEYGDKMKWPIAKRISSKRMQGNKKKSEICHTQKL